MLEITNDTQYLIPIMLTVMVAKWIGDYLSHPYYDAILELRDIPVCILTSISLIMSSC